MTTEEHIARLEKPLQVMFNEPPSSEIEEALVAIACELRALRLMLRDEIREAAWRMASVGTYGPAAIASRKAPPLEEKP